METCGIFFEASIHNAVTVLKGLKASQSSLYSAINSMLKNNKYLEYGKAAKENSNNFRWDQIINKYKKILI